MNSQKRENSASQSEMTRDRSTMNEMENRILRRDDSSKEYEKLQKHRNGISGKVGHHKKTKSMYHRHKKKKEDSQVSGTDQIFNRII